MSLTQAYHDTRILEAAVNYTKADETSISLTEDAKPDLNEVENIYSDEQFWKNIFADPESYWDKDFKTGYQVTLSEWVARVPGMFWHSDSQQFHELAEKSIFKKLPNGLRVYPPMTKSTIVMGGTGTLKLSPILDLRLCSISTNKNASVGIPVLIHPEVWEYHKLKEGDTINGTFRWKKMESQWAQNFLSTKNIVRGYLELRHPDQITKGHEDGENMFHPFSIMEYERNSLRYYDFMFLTMNTRITRDELKDFLRTYALENGNGRYLIECDINNPIFEGQFTDPAHFRNEGKEHLQFMETRLKDILKGEDIQEEVLTALTTYYSPDDLNRVSTSIGISPALWNIGGAMADVAVAFLNEVNQKDNLHQLIEAIQRDHHEAITD